MSNAATLAKLAIAVATQRQAKLAARVAKAESAATANEALVRNLAAERVADMRERASTAPSREQSAELVREVFAIEGVVRGVFAELKDELRGKDGQNVTAQQVEATVRAVFAEMAPGLKGKDGKTVKPEAVLAMVQDVFAQHRAELKGEPGKDVDLVQISAMVRQSLEALGHTQPTAEAMQAAIKAEVQMIAPELRGAPGAPGLVWKGEWQRGTTYQAGDVVRYRAASYIAVRETVGVQPGTDKRHWDVMVKDGTDGGGGGGFASTSSDTGKKWTLANSEYPHFGYQDGADWKIERVNANGTYSTARKAANGAIDYAAAWAGKESLNYA